MAPTFEEFLVEAEAEPVEGWDFSWFDGRATEERPSWAYAELLGDRMTKASAALDLQTGGGEVLAQLPHPPKLLVATEGWPPNAEVARRNLTPLGATVVEVTEDADLPFADESFDLVVSRHPIVANWHEIARVLRPGGTYLSQRVGDGSNRELSEAMLGPLPPVDQNSARKAAAAAEAAGLTVVDLQAESLRVVFDDIGAVVYFLRKVLWTVPGFTVEKYRPQLAKLHEQIQTEGPFVAHSQRFLIEARRR
jgi:SAM-dependent methyltransferase